MDAQAQLDRYLDVVLAGSKLRGAAADQVRWELGSHLRELFNERVRSGLAADLAAEAAIADFGDAEMLGPAIGAARTGPASRGLVRPALTAAAAVAVAVMLLGRTNDPHRTTALPKTEVVVAVTSTAPAVASERPLAAAVSAPVRPTAETAKPMPEPAESGPLARISPPEPIPTVSAPADGRGFDRAALRKLMERLFVLILMQRGSGGTNP